MSAFEVLTQAGTGRLLRFTALLGLFVLLHLIRLVLRAPLWLIETAMRAVDHAVTGYSPPGTERFASQ